VRELAKGSNLFVKIEKDSPLLLLYKQKAKKNLGTPAKATKIDIL
jgi:hypothetical protein